MTLIHCNIENHNPYRLKHFDLHDVIRCYQDENGVVMPSVTTYLDAVSTNGYLWKWKRKNQHEPASLGIELPKHHDNIYTYRGEIVHKRIEDFLTGDKTIITEFEHELTDGFYNLFAEFLPLISDVHSMEINVQCPDLKIAGRYDAIIEFNQKNYLVDWKTSGKLKDEGKIQDYITQISIYHHLISINFPDVYESLAGGLICIACHDSESVLDTNRRKHIDELRIFEYSKKELENTFKLFLQSEYVRFWNWVKFI